jgi:two-component system, OmpR family, sensor kinase
MAAWSMAGRLAGKLTLLLILAWLLAVATAALTVRYEMNEVFDGVLQETAQEILPDIIERQGATLLDPATPTPIVMPAVPHDEYITYQVLGADGRLLLRSHQAPTEPYVLPIRQGFSSPGGGRVYTEPSVDGRLAIQIAEPRDHRSEAIRSAVVWLILPLTALVPITAWLVPWSVRRGLRPLLALQAEIRQRNRSNLAEIAPTAMPLELQPILADVNLLLHRLGRALESERSFATNSAHELRTPIASALANAQLLMAQLAPGDPRAGYATALASQLRRLGRHVTKLLELARADAGVALTRQPVDLLPVLHLVLEEFAHQPGMAARLRLQRAGLEEFVVYAHVDAAAIALRNLLENAIVHGAPDGPIDITFGPDASLTVTNQSPIVPPEQLSRLTERFHRRPSTHQGCGLGLAIVRAIMEQSGGALILRSPVPGRADGFAATLQFPRAA